MLIKRLPRRGAPNVRIAARLRFSRTTVIKAVKSQAPPVYVSTLIETPSARLRPGRAIVIGRARYAGVGAG